MKTETWETIEDVGKRLELDLDKLFCLLLNVLGEVRQEVEEEPTCRNRLELEILQEITDEYRSHMREGSDLFTKLTGWMYRKEHASGRNHFEDRREERAEEEYPMDTIYHAAVAEQEQDLRKMYPSRFGEDCCRI